MSTNNNLTPPCLALPASDLAYRVTASGFDKPSEDDWVASQIYSYAGVYQYGYAYDDQPQEKPKDRLESACLIYIDYGGHLTLSFRGTAGKGNCGMLKDWLTNLDCDLVKMKTPQGELEVHHGFKKELDVIWKGIMHWVRHFDPEAKRKINITGHSQGGALAFIAATKLAQEKTPEGKYYNNIQGVTTFAAPKPGSLSFANYYNDLKLQNEVTLGSVTVRYENTADLVPLLPPKFGFPSKVPEWLDIIVQLMKNVAIVVIDMIDIPQEEFGCKNVRKELRHIIDVMTKDTLSKEFYPVGDTLKFIGYKGKITSPSQKAKEGEISEYTLVWIENFLDKISNNSDYGNQMIENIKNWDFIEAAKNAKKIYDEIMKKPEHLVTTLLEAHTLQPGNGYMLAACPNEAFAKGSDGKEFIHASKSK
ncbi:lipase family protein [uncultured Microscilla sp.]|uniref:lipase family protein n=1 Tax=uncultured Microscilla sp. TaxID=432653 RepID=UPI002623B538|nr:lipase family protein [uncultured Microscilla sp.]